MTRLVYGSVEVSCGAHTSMAFEELEVADTLAAEEGTRHGAVESIALRQGCVAECREGTLTSIDHLDDPRISRRTTR